MLPLWSFQGARGAHAPLYELTVPAARSLKTQQHDVEVDVVLGELGHRTTIAEAIAIGRAERLPE